MSLYGRVVAMNRFISKATNKCIPFFDVIKKKLNFEWKKIVRKPSRNWKTILRGHQSCPVHGRGIFYLYMTVFEHAISFVLVIEDRELNFRL